MTTATTTLTRTATAEQVDRIVAELYEFARTPGTIASTPRFVEAWATKSTS
jgi:hypothetical protein